jgi:hypothetical protein
MRRYATAGKGQPQPVVLQKKRPRIDVKKALSDARVLKISGCVVNLRMVLGPDYADRYRTAELKTLEKRLRTLYEKEIDNETFKIVNLGAYFVVTRRRENEHRVMV